MHQSIGTLDSILACSAEKFVMDEEIVTRVQRMKRGIGEFPDDLMDVIEEGRESGSFLGLLDTALNFKDQIYFPTFSDRSNYEAWTSKGKSNELKASDIVGMRLSEYVEPDIGVSLKKELRDYATKQGADISSILS
jgi:trimethylamine:corrinoid methyltransferase-like protein